MTPHPTATGSGTQCRAHPIQGHYRKLRLGRVDLAQLPFGRTLKTAGLVKGIVVLSGYAREVGCARGGGQPKALVQAVDFAIQRRRAAAWRAYLIHGRDKTLKPFPVFVQVVAHEFSVRAAVK